MNSNSEFKVVPGDFFGLLEKSGYRSYAQIDPSKVQNGFIKISKINPKKYMKINSNLNISFNKKLIISKIKKLIQI